MPASADNKPNGMPTTPPESLTRFAYRDREGRVHIVFPVIPLPANLWVCRREDDGAEMFLHASHLQPLTD